jgi:hypothetical protein
MHHGNCQGYMPHSLSSDCLLSNFYTASIADNAFVANTFVFTTMTFPVFYRPKNLLTKETIFFRLE